MKSIKRALGFKSAIVALGTLAMVACASMDSSMNSSASMTEKEVLKHYTVLAHAMYQDSLTTAISLQKAVIQFIGNPTEDSLSAAKSAWLDARVPYQQTEVYRFGNAVVDDWEGKVNAWPLDEGLIDYVSGEYGSESEENPVYVANIVANTSVSISGETIDTEKITKELIADTLHEIGGVEANVATGYHAIEFLLWGQDLNGTGPGAGMRMASDFDTANCTNGNCSRRAKYLKVASELLVDDLKWIVAQWAPGGDASEGIINGEVNEGLTAIVTGMGSLSYGELAGERMQLGLLLHDPEEEHDCFSDNTHNSHYYDAMGIRNVYVGEYRRIDGSVVSGPGLSSLVAASSADVDAELMSRLDETMDAMGVLVKSAEGGEAYDQMIGDNNDSGNAKVQAAIDALTAQTAVIEKAVDVLQLAAIEFEGSDSLDDPEAVFE